MSRPSGTLPVAFEFAAPGAAGDYPVEVLVNPNQDQPAEETNILTGEWPGDNYANDTLIVEDPCTDISVVSPYSGSSGAIPIGSNVQIGATVKRANDGPNGAVQVKVTATGPGFNETKTISLTRGGSQRVTFIPRINNATTTFRIKAEPIGAEDCAPSNNQTSITINARDMDGMPIPDATDIWSELVHTR